jgi:hypothetical protein
VDQLALIKTFTALTDPLRLTGRYKLINDALCGVGEIAELSLKCEELVKLGKFLR